MASSDHDVLLASCVHGEAVPETFQQELNDAISLFVADRNVERFTGALVRAARASGLASRGMGNGCVADRRNLALSHALDDQKWAAHIHG